MKKIMLLMMAAGLWAASEPKKEIEIAIDRYQDRACDKAKKQAKEGYEVVDMSGCTCEMTDEREWQCFVRFTHNGKREQP